MVGCLWLVTAAHPNSSRFQVHINKLTIVDYSLGTKQLASLSFGYGRDPEDGHTLVRTLAGSRHPAVITLEGPAAWILLTMRPGASKMSADDLRCAQLTISEYGTEG